MRDEGKEHRAVSRVIQILEYAAQSEEGVSMAELVRELDAPRSSVHGLVGGLVACGYLQIRDRAYYLGAAVRNLRANRQSLEAVAKPFLATVAERIEETVMLAVRSAESLIYTEAVESHYNIRYSPTLHERRELYPASAGKCFLAYGPAELRKNYAKKHFTGPKRQAVLQELEEIVAQGYAVNRGETIPDVTAIAVPLKSADILLGCIVAAGPIMRIPVERTDEIVQLLQWAATEIGDAID